MTDALEFLRPAWLLGLLPVAVWLRLRRAARARGSWVDAIDPAFRPRVVQPGSGQAWGPWTPPALAAVLLIALAGPVWRGGASDAPRPDALTVIVFDLSASMDVRDASPSRLAQAQVTALDMLSEAPGEFALIAYAGEPFRITPPTADRETVRHFVNALHTGLMPVGGNRAEAAFELALEAVSRSDARLRRVLWLSDGEGEADALVASARRLAEAGARVDAVGVGTAAGGLVEALVPRVARSSLQRGVLEGVAAAGGGRYFESPLSPEARRALIDVPPGRAAASGRHGLDLAPWLIGLLGLPLAALLFRRGLVFTCVCAVLVPLPTPADDRAAREAFASGRYDEAAAGFQDPRWRAAAMYRAGNFAEAARIWDRLPGIDALYNRANALARLERIPEARALYEAVLALAPDHADAQFNLDLLTPPRGGSGDGGGGGGAGGGATARVPDAPGDWLRRKFERELERRGGRRVEAQSQ